MLRQHQAAYIVELLYGAASIRNAHEVAASWCVSCFRDLVVTGIMWLGSQAEFDRIRAISRLSVIPNRLDLIDVADDECAFRKREHRGTDVGRNLPRFVDDQQVDRVPKRDILSLPSSEERRRHMEVGHEAR